MDIENGVCHSDIESPLQFYTFHQRCGRRITLSNGRRTATRSMNDFSHALVFSSTPLKNDVIFEVVIDKKNNSWGGSIEIGVTTKCPDDLEMPPCAAALRSGSWVMSGIDVRKDGICLIEFYGTDLETLEEGERVGVMRTSNGELHFFVNGKSQGIAAKDMPTPLWALVDLYGRSVQVSLYPSNAAEQRSQNIDVPVNIDVSVVTTFDDSESCCPMLMSNGNLINQDNNINININDIFDTLDHIRFHTRCGSLVKLSCNYRSAERRRPLDEFNNGVVMTHRPLKDDELFEIRIDKLIDKWSGSIEVGVTTHNPAVLHFPATMTNMRSGTIMMSGCGILTNGKGTRRQYGEFNLDELREGDRVGMMRKKNGNLHYYINGKDQGIAATCVTNVMWGVIDLYGMTIKVSIVNPDDREQHNLITRIYTHQMPVNALNTALAPAETINSSDVWNLTTTNYCLSTASTAGECVIGSVGGGGGGNGSVGDDHLTFHPICGLHVAVMYNGRTAVRPNASEDFNNGVVLTSRPLRPNELFQVRLERIVTKWAGSIELGVTIHSAEELEFPFTMTNVRTGTWMMTGNGVMHNGLTVIEHYGRNLDRLEVGDCVGVVRRDNGTLHFYVNGIDQGSAASNIPERVYGVIDLYGQAAQASIVDKADIVSPDTDDSSVSDTTPYSELPLRFHTVHGKNAVISNNGITASRPNSLAEFNDALVFSNRPLRQNEIFEVVLETMVRHWSGNIEIGVTGTRPEEIQLTSNASDLEAFSTVILCGAMIFHNRKTIRSNITIDLDSLGAGSRVGVLRSDDFIHFVIDGVDQGPSVICRTPNIWAVIDLYGQCAQVSLTPQLHNHHHQDSIRAPYAISENSQSCQGNSMIQPISLETKHRWTSTSCNALLSQNWRIATRIAGSQDALSSCVVFSEYPLVLGSVFEFVIISHNSLYAKCLSFGVTDLNVIDGNARKNVPRSIDHIPANVWYVTGNEVRQNAMILETCTTSLEWLRSGDRISLELIDNYKLRLLLNSKYIGVTFDDISKNVHVVVELHGATMAVETASIQGPISPLRPSTLRLQDSLDFGADILNKPDSLLESLNSEIASNEFSNIHGQNIILLDGDRSAMRTRSYSHGVVFVNKPLLEGESVAIKIDKTNTLWSGTIGIGVAGPHLKEYNNGFLPQSMSHFKRQCWLITNDLLNMDGHKISTRYADALEQIKTGSIITLTLTQLNSIVITVDTIKFIATVGHIRSPVFPVFDIYGQCERISLIPYLETDDFNNGMSKNIPEI